MKNNELCVLVLGVGGNIGQGILKALRLSGLPHRVVGACVGPQAFGLYTTDRSYVSPYFNEPHFLDWLLNTAQTEKVDVILTGVEPLLYFLAEHADEIKKQSGAVCFTSPPQKLLIAQDKWLTAQWLQSHGFNFPRSALADDAEAVEELIDECGLSLFAKPRFGRSGVGIFRVEDLPTLHFVTQKKDYILQEYLGDDRSEYTAGSFTDQTGEVKGLIIMKRELLEGTTYRAELGEFPEVRAEVFKIIQALKPVGPCNLQLRTTSRGAVCFEINMRFSGTTPIKARFGFNEVKASLEHFILGKETSLPNVTHGIALRYWNELYIDMGAYENLCRSQKLVGPDRCPSVLENYGGNVSK